MEKHNELTWFDNFLAEVKKNPINQTNTNWEENIPESVWEGHFRENYKILETNLDIDRHRWYERSTTVINIDGRFLGMNLVTNIFSESMGVEDIVSEVLFFEMEEVQTVSYREIKTS